MRWDKDHSVALKKIYANMVKIRACILNIFRYIDALLLTHGHAVYQYVMQQIKRGTLGLWAFLDKDESIQKIIKETTRNFNPFSKFECLDQFSIKVSF